MTLQELKNARLKRYLECEEKILLNQSYKVGNHEYTRADLEAVRKVIEALLEDGAYLEEEPPKNGRVKRLIFA